MDVVMRDNPLVPALLAAMTLALANGIALYYLIFA